MSRAGPSRIWRDAQAVADVEQHVVVVDLEAVEFELAVAAVLLRAEDADAAHDPPAGLVAVIEERREAAPRIVRGARDQDEMRRAVGAGDEPFAAVDHPFAVPAFGAGADHAGIGAAARRRLGHGEGRAHLALDDRAQPALLLGRRAGAREQIHVAVVGRHAVEGERPEDRARGLLVHRRPGDDRQRHAAELLGRLRRPQAFGLRLGAHRLEAFVRDVLVLGEIHGIRFERQHMALDEGAGAQAQVFDVGRQREIHLSFPEPIPCSATIWPPSTTMVAPAMKRPASEASSKQRAVEIAVAAEPADRDVAGELLAFLGREVVAVDLGDEPARRDGVDADALEGELEAERLRHLHHAGLGRRIGDDALADAEAEHRGDVDDGARLARRQHPPRRLLRPQKNTASRLVAMTRRHSSSGSSTARVEWATPALLTRMVTVPNAASAASKARRIAARVEHVGLDRQRPAAGRRDLLLQRDDAVLAPGDERDRGAVRRQHLGKAQPEPARRAGDEADPAAEIEQFGCLHHARRPDAGREPSRISARPP